MDGHNEVQIQFEKLYAWFNSACIYIRIYPYSLVPT